MFIWKVVIFISMWKTVPAASLASKPSSQVDQVLKTLYACEHNDLHVDCVEGEFIHIIQAKYGRLNKATCNADGGAGWPGGPCMSNRSHIIVTDRCENKQTCSVAASNVVFGDPCSGIIKYLEVQYSCIPHNQLSNTLYACEHKELHVDCKESGVIHIIRASYGRSNRDTCNEDGGVWWLGETCMSDKSYHIMTDSCERKSTCSVEVSNDVFHDPCPGTIKYLEVQYSCVPPPTVTRTIEHSSMLNNSSTSELDAATNSSLDHRSFKTLYACEHKQLYVDCAESGVIHIITAIYGRLKRDTCNEDGGSGWPSKPCMSDSSYLKMTDRCEQKKTCSIAASNSVFGDPCSRIFKYLEVEYSCVPPPTVTSSTEQSSIINSSSISEFDPDVGPLKMSYACEHKQVHLDCVKGDVIHIIRATYGRLNRSTCNEYGNLTWTGRPCMSDKSHLIITDRCEQKKSCNVTASYRIFGDPCFGTHKYLEVQYSCVPQPTVTSTTEPSSTHNTTSATFLDTLTNNSLDNRHFRTIYSCEAKALHVDCVEGGVIHIIRANYGRINRDMCNEYGNVTWTGEPCMSDKSYHIMTDRCEQKESCTVTASHEIFGDPCFGTVKYLEVQYSCVALSNVTSTTEQSSILNTPSTSKLDISTRNSPGLTQSNGADDSVHCARGWFYFKDKCYKLGGKRESGRLQRKQAAEKCVSEGGNLVIIHSRELQEFLVTFLLLDAKTNSWIGLHDRIEESNYSWDDGSKLSYTNWPPAGPSGKERPEEDCVEMVFLFYHGNWETGMWNDFACDGPRAYICEAKTSRESSPDPRLCSSGGWKHLSTCYHVISEIKSWDDAEQHCQNTYNGHLITILDFTVDLFIQYVLSNTDRDVWIGIKIQEQPLQQWESGWYVGYSEWGKDESEEFVIGTCVLRSRRKSWKKVPCSKKYSFICEAPSVGPPVLKQAVEGAKCPELPEDWLDLGGEYCYYFEVKSKVNWYKANMECIRRGGSLVSIHSEEETAILQKFIIYTQNSVNIGFLRPKAHDDLFMWTDGSRWNYENWNKNEPNNEDEKCGEMFTENMKWNDANCDHECGYICSVRKVSPNVTQHIEQQMDCTSSVSFKVVIGVSVCILLVVILIGCVIYCFRTGGVQRRKTSFGVELQPPVPTSQRPMYRSSDNTTKEDNDYYENMGWGGDSK